MKAILLDRDGTIIVDPPDLRVDSVDEVELFPDTIEALRLLHEAGFKLIVVSNQAGIGEGRITREDFETITAHVAKMIAPSGIELVATYVCPHVPEDNCECRKPKPTMILRAAEKYDVNLAESYYVGDSRSDIMAGINAGTKTILVKTANIPVVSKEADYTAQSLLEAAQYIVNQA